MVYFILMMMTSLKELRSLSLGIYSLINLTPCLIFNIFCFLFLSFTFDVIFKSFNKILMIKLKIFLHHFIKW